MNEAERGKIPIFTQDSNPQAQQTPNYEKKIAQKVKLLPGEARTTQNQFKGENYAPGPRRLNVELVIIHLSIAHCNGILHF